MLNKEEPHIRPLTKLDREGLKQVIFAMLPDNDQKLITPKMVRDTLLGMVDSVLNLNDDNVDLRAYQTDILTVNQPGQTVFKLTQVPINPEPDSRFEVEGIVQQYGVDYTISNDELTVIQHPNWSLKTSHSLSIQYRYFQPAPVSGGGSGGNGGGSGGNGTLAEYEQQLNNQLSITINHNLDRYPNVRAVIGNKLQMVLDVEYPSRNQLIVRFRTPQSGVIIYS